MLFLGDDIHTPLPSQPPIDASSDRGQAPAAPLDGVRRRKARRIAGNLQDLVETSRNLVNLFQGAETSRASRFALSEEARGAREERKLEVETRLESARIDSQRESTKAICEALQSIATSLGDLKNACHHARE